MNRPRKRRSKLNPWSGIGQQGVIQPRKKRNKLNSWSGIGKPGVNRPRKRRNKLNPRSDTGKPGVNRPRRGKASKLNPRSCPGKPGMNRPRKRRNKLNSRTGICSLANRYTYDLFQQFFPDFKIYATREKYESNPNRIPLKQFRISEERVGFCWGEQDNQSFTVEKDERYAVMVKLSKEDFHSKDHGTVHILFGNGIEGTLAISRYLLFHYKDINKLVRSRRHYFVAFKVKRKTGIIDTDSFVDLTDQMFK